MSAGTPPMPSIARSPGCPVCGMIYCMCDITSQQHVDASEQKFTQLS